MAEKIVSKVSLKKIKAHPDLRIIEVESEGYVERLYLDLEELNTLKGLLKIECGKECKCQK